MVKVLQAAFSMTMKAIRPGKTVLTDAIYVVFAERHKKCYFPLFEMQTHYQGKEKIILTNHSFLFPFFKFYLN